MNLDIVSLFDFSSTFSSRSNSSLQFELDTAEITMAIEETQLDEPSSTDGGHLAKDHAAQKKSKEGAKKTSDTNKRGRNRNRNRNKTTPTAAVTIQEDEDEDQTSDEEEDGNVTAGFSTIFNNNWI
jgi:hypothetical protein